MCLKLVEVGGQPCIKISLDVGKVTVPGRKNLFRLYGKEGFALLDLMQGIDEPEPVPHNKVLCRHPFEESKRCYALPTTVENLLQLWWKDGKVIRLNLIDLTLKPIQLYFIDATKIA